MGKGRLEAFSDGMFAIILTIMVLELKVPAEHAELGALVHLKGAFASYLLSYVNLGIYWNNHHHLLHATKTVTGGVLWANLLLLFFLSLMPFATGWMGENSFAATPMAVYGGVLICSALSYTNLQRVIIRAQGPDSLVARATGSDFKGKVSLVCYALGCPMAFVNRAIAGALYVTVALIWLVPDKRIERVLRQSPHEA